MASEGGSIRGFTEREMIKGQTVSFMAVADQHHEFAQWRADESSDCPDLLEPMKATISFEVIGNCVLEAVFLKASRTIITSVSQGGQITPPQTVEHGQAVSITVGLEEDYTFKAWSGTCGEFNPLETTITFTATKDCEISAILEQKTYTITALASEGGSIRGFTEREMIKGQTVSFMAVADQHHEFAQWRADESSDCPDLLEPMKATISFEVIGNCVLEAVFLKTSRTIITSVNKGGTITPTKKVPHGQAVSITVGLEEDYTFKAWSGTCGEFNPLETTITFTATKDCEISAILEQKTYTITALASEGGSIRGFTEREMIKGQTVSFMAVADQHHEFAQWRADESSDCPDLLEPMKATISFEVIGNCVLEAVFIKTSRTIITSVNKGGTITPTKKVPHGQAVSITVSIDEGYRFQAWTSNCGDFSSHRATTITFMATKDCQVTAMLEEEPLPVDDCSNPLEIAPNGHTLRVKPACESHRTTLVGQTVTFHGVDYTIVDNEKIKEQRNQGRSMAHIVTTFVTDMRGLFSRNQGCDEHNKNCQFINSTFNENISTWDVSKVTTMDLMFSGAQAFNQDIGHWDVSSVTTMGAMFDGASAFNQDIGDWTISKVTDTNNMFAGASKFNKDIGDWDVSKVTSMGNMFSGAVAFNQDIGDWDVGNITSMSSMFYRASAFNQDIRDWNVSNVTNMFRMFYRASAFNQDIRGWNVSNVTTMTAMFTGASAFNQDLSGWIVNNVKNCAGFYYSSALTQLQLPLFIHCTP